MKIAIDARGINWYRGTGIGTYTEKLLKYILNLDNETNYNLYWSGENYDEFKKVNTKIIMASKKHHRFFEQYYFPNNISNEKVDIFHMPQNGIGMNDTIPCKKIITIHDLIPFVMPETVGKGYLIKFLKEVPKAIESADAILTVSEWSKKDILRFVPIDEKKIFVTPLSADDKYKPLNKDKCKLFLGKKYNINKPFILYIGGFSPRKNVRSLMIAFSKIYQSLNSEYNLVIIGANKDDCSYLNELSINLNLASNIIFTGFVPENHLPILYNACDVFVYPSFYEGFGLPPLEAMSCGTPVITSNVSSIPEVVQDAGILINPYDTSVLMDSLLKILNDENLRNDLKQKGLERAKNFSWEKTAAKTLEVYRKVYNETIAAEIL